MINFNSADPKYMLKLGLVRFGLARFKSLWTLRICLVQRYKKGIETSPWITMLKMTLETGQNKDIFLNFFANFLGVLENRLLYDQFQ